jgi:hypothetical protein
MMFVLVFKENVRPNFIANGLFTSMTSHGTASGIPGLKELLKISFRRDLMRSMLLRSYANSAGGKRDQTRHSVTSRAP